MLLNPLGHFDTQLDDPDIDIYTDAPPSPPTFLNTSLDNGIPEDIQDEAILFNLDNNNDFNCPHPPWATFESLASMQTIIEQIQDASFNNEEKQCSDDEFDTFLHPRHEQFCLDDLQLCLSLLTYMALSVHSSEATYTAVHRSIKECYYS